MAVVSQEVKGIVQPRCFALCVTDMQSIAVCFDGIKELLKDKRSKWSVVGSVEGGAMDLQAAMQKNSVPLPLISHVKYV